MKKNVVILGSTGSIGINTLKVIARHPQRFRVVGLSAYSNLRLLERQIKEFGPTHVAIGGENIQALKERWGRRIKIFNTVEEIVRLVCLPEVDVVVIGMSGSAALEPFLAALRAGKTVAPANKEALVIAGDILMREAKKHGAAIIPIDSEQSAIFQCLQGAGGNEVDRIFLTASGGALHKVPQRRFDKLSVADILNHPRWKMGKKITVDSATLMNKGFEVIEAKHLFGLDVDEIEVVVHPEAIIHSMVRFKDGSILAQLGVTDMRIPIQYALTYPDRCPTGLAHLDLIRLGQLRFEKPDIRKFPSLALAFHAGRKGGTLPSVLNAADEVAVNAFLNGKIRFSQIYRIVERTVLKHRVKASPVLQDIRDADVWAREEAIRLTGR